jgi:hypothetical protein
MVLAEAVTHKGFENPLRLNLSNSVDSDKSAEHEICSSVHDRFRCAYVASVGRFAPALSDQTNAAISRRYDCDRRRFASRHAQEGAGQRAKVGAKKVWNRGVPPVRPGDLVRGSGFAGYDFHRDEPICIRRGGGGNRTRE